jgi:glycosyltransferase involved in cell wall biosynthesis
MLSGADMKRKYHLPFDLIERYGLPFYQNFIATTPATANYIKSICPKANLEIIPNGIKPMITHNNVFNKSVITFLGRIEINQKGLDLLISAFEHLKMPHTTLLIAGSGTKNEVEKLSDLISKSPNRDRIHLLGRVAGDKKKDLFAKSACIVIPSRFETFSIVALEALANRVSLVTFDITGLKWIPKSVRSYGTVLSPESLSSAIRRVLIDRTYRQSLTTQGYDFSRKFTWNNAAKKYDMFINQINCKTHTVPGITERIKRLSSSYASRLKNLLDIIYPNSLKLN